MAISIFSFLAACLYAILLQLLKQYLGLLVRAMDLLLQNYKFFRYACCCSLCLSVFVHTFLQFFGSLQPYAIVQAKPFAMHNFNLHSEFYNQPILLTEEEKRDPLSVIKRFLEDVKLLEVRIHLYNLLKVALTTPNTIYDEASERDAVVCFVKQLEKMVEAAFVYRHSHSLFTDQIIDSQKND